MKWNNKGHEYDEMYQKMKEKKNFFLFGAGDYGEQFLRLFESEIQITGYIDNSPDKQGTRILGKYCYSLNEIELNSNEGIILTMSQLARVKPIEQLNQIGYKRNVDYFIIEEFLSVYHVYKNNLVYFSKIGRAHV